MQWADIIAAMQRWRVQWTAAISLAAMLGLTQAASSASPADDELSGQPIARTRPLPQGEVAAQIGLVAAHRRHQGNLPTGQGVPMGHVEGGQDSYMPNMTLDQFRRITFAPRSGQSKPFKHANATGSVMYGTNGLAPGIRTVHSFSTRDWMTDGYLRTGSSRPPKNGKLRLFNHSWIGNPGEPAKRILRRVDYQIDRRGVVMCVGVNNGKKSKVPHLLASAYNVISVGAAKGNSSGGYTRIETEGRCKPELIAPKGMTSFATPVVTACTARLLEQADRIQAKHPDQAMAAQASRPEVIKATLLAGATKPKGWAPAEGKPLDAHLGAGMVNFDHSLSILKGPPTDSRQLRRSANWRYDKLAATETRVYSFRARRSLGSASLVLTWHRQVSGPGGQFNFAGQSTGRWSATAGVANFNLELVRLDRHGKPTVLAKSASSIDNVEHIFQSELEPGRYRVKVTRPADGYQRWPYALAWRIAPAPTETQPTSQ
jgi:hypothetical protein